MTLELIHNAFAMIYRRIPGRYHELRRHLESAPPEVVREFSRIIHQLDNEIAAADRRARMPWMR